MMFHIVCSLGYPVALDSAARGMGYPGKPPGISGVKAPKLWAEGRYNEVLEYVAQDVRTAIQIAQAAERRRRFEWITRKGTRNTMCLSTGWFTVREASLLPLPDTSWMTRPLTRQSFMDWLTSPSARYHTPSPPAPNGTRTHDAREPAGTNARRA
jgi:hypothetical protein